MGKMTYEPSVFGVRDPPCGICHEEMDFKIFENYNGTGTDWLQWCCKNLDCGSCFNVEIL